MPPDPSARAVLYADGERPDVATVRAALDGRSSLRTAASGEQAVRILAEPDVAVLLVGESMADMSSIELCERARQLRPEVVRVLLPAESDLGAALAAVRRGQASHVVSRPLRTEELTEALRSAVERFETERSVHDLALRLLRSGPSSTARTIRAELAHELNNYLTSLTVCVQQVSDLTGGALRVLAVEPTRASELLAVSRDAQADAAAALDQMKSMVERLRSDAESDEGTTGEPGTDASHVVRTTVHIVRPELRPRAHLRVELEGSPLVTMDAAALGQVVMHLLLHAAQAVGRGDRGADHSIGVHLGVRDERAVVTVSDTGPPISSELADRVADSYFTSRQSESGLGLAVVRDLIHRAGGNISAEPGAERGTTFTVSLPLAPGSTGAAP